MHTDRLLHKQVRYREGNNYFEKICSRYKYDISVFTNADNSKASLKQTHNVIDVVEPFPNIRFSEFLKKF